MHRTSKVAVGGAKSPERKEGEGQWQEPKATLVLSLPSLHPLRVRRRPHPHPRKSQLPVHRVLTNPEVLADLHQRPPLFVQLRRQLHLRRCQSHRLRVHSTTSQQPAHRAAVDAELLRQGIDTGARSVPSHQLIHLRPTELLHSAVGRRWWSRHRYVIRRIWPLADKVKESPYRGGVV